MQRRSLIGIDLGTTNSLVAVFEDGAPRLLPNAHGEMLTPSAVGVLESGEVLVGAAAKLLAITEPDRVVTAFKRWMGEDRTVTVGGHDFTPEELSSLVLRSLVADAESALGTSIDRAVITVPAYFNQHQRESTKQAAELAGLAVDRIVNEPTAAALVYGFHERSKEQRLLVLDLGGGTFDVTAMEIFEETLEILSTAGESFLGGEDFTNALASHVLEQNGRTFEVAEMREPLLVSRLRAEAEQAKRALTEDRVASLRLPASDGSIDPASEPISVTREDFASVTETLVDRIRRPILRALRDAEMQPSEVDDVLLVGGATRMSIVRELANEIFDKEPMHAVHPDEAVALGAAVQAALIADDRAVDDLVMTDVCPHTLGIEVVKELAGRMHDGYFMPVLHRNTTIPVSKEESVSTIEDGQTKILIRIYQGESRKVEQNLLLGELAVKGIQKGPKGQEVCVRFTYDLNGLLEVEAFVPATGKKFSTVLKNHAKNLSQRAVAASLKRMADLKFYPREDLENQRLLAFASAAVREVDRFRREELERSIDRYESEFHGNEREAFETAREHLLLLLSSLGLPYEGIGDVD